MAIVHTEKFGLFVEDHIIAWQTGRFYSNEGQRVAAAFTDDGRIVFLDYDRGIDGEMPAPDNDYYRDTKDHARQIRDYIMTEYDYGRYTHTNDRELVKCLGLVCKYRVEEMM